MGCPVYCAIAMTSSSLDPWRKSMHLGNLAGVLEYLCSHGIYSAETGEVLVHAAFCSVPGVCSRLSRSAHNQRQTAGNCRCSSTNQHSRAALILDLINYYTCFIQNLATWMQPLNQLLHKETPGSGQLSVRGLLKMLSPCLHLRF